MILTENEKQAVYKMIFDSVNYQETVDEVYDHVITALEQKTSPSADIRAAAMLIIHNDFGGFSKLKRAERKRLNTWTIWKLQANILLTHLKFPLVLYTVPLSLCIYWIVQQMDAREPLIFLILAFAVLPGIYQLYRILTTDPIKAKPSVWDTKLSMWVSHFTATMSLFSYLPYPFFTEHKGMFNFILYGNNVAISMFLTLYLVFWLGVISNFRNSPRLQKALFI